ncbi:RNA polymerase RpoN-/SigL-like sigma 54 subunit [Hydrogenivirga caldilitoris]|uniref:RNA polymerase RpoN-/SigL-like sigma 54 subunit n=1 Tax=Hydrogenivirga caldilitoris TaxID=246264 RepID=A0A497XVG6_9AQUI|nr:RNA polymerase subunit sigma-54 [Hydrogenivirga caldilitoris]RLJ70793.1 RNA polymerase RpoN-/SigL-like sigma 54 subunit [Hydrogenivirga caldilitoris]
MMLKNELQLKLKANLNLLLRNQVEILLHPVQELEQLLKEEKESNPFIEEVCVCGRGYELFEERKSPEPIVKAHPLETLQRNVRAELEGIDIEIANELISQTDERGFFKGDISKIARKYGVDESYVEDIREFIMKLEPLGICSKNLLEFVKLQVEELYPDEPELLSAFEEALAGKPLPKEAKLKLSHVRLSPIEEDVSVPRVGKVDAVIELDDGELVGYVYEELIEIKPNRYYMEVLPKVKGEAREFLKEYMERYENFKKILSIRKENLKGILNEIITVQEAFLKGEGNLKSLLVKDVAQKLDISESTVSRLISSKYVKTPQGTYPFKFFFVRETVGGVSQEELMREIKEVISKEDRRKPLSDDDIARILKGKGYDVARRTVAKYREVLGIPSSRERRER